VDVRETRSSKNADKFLLIKPGSDYEVITALRLLISGKADLVPEEVGGAPKKDLSEVAEAMKASKFGALFFGLGLASSRGSDKNEDARIVLVAT
jgi:formylmethanofuran dehydrogenase subunit B